MGNDKLGGQFQFVLSKAIAVIKLPLWWNITAEIVLFHSRWHPIFRLFRTIYWLYTRPRPLSEEGMSSQIELPQRGETQLKKEVREIVMAKQSKPNPRKKTTSKSSTSPSARQSKGKSRPPQKNSPYKGAPRKTVRKPPERDLEADMDAREELLEGSLEQVYTVYEESLGEGVYFPVVFLVDCEDELGGRLARDWVGREEVDEAIEANHAGGSNTITTTFAQCLSFQDCQDYVPQMFPYLQGSFQQAPPEGTFIAIVIASGGAGSFFVPYEDVEE